MRNLNGQLYLSAIPGHESTVSQWVAEVRSIGISQIISLTPRSEVLERSPEYATARIREMLPPITEIPIADFNVPEGTVADRFWIEAQEVATRIANGEKILVHCAGGIGRTGMFAVAVLLASGYELSEARETIASLGSHAEMPRQRRFLENYPKTQNRDSDE